LIKTHAKNLLVHGVRLICPNCGNEVFVNLEDGVSQCTRCGWKAQQLASEVHYGKNDRLEKTSAAP
jgi:ribosomal protein L37AE/L43A